MKKIFFVLASVAITLASQAQTKFHDVEANDAKGPVKTVTVKSDEKGQQVFSFSAEGKIESNATCTINNAVYDSNGYVLSYILTAAGQKTEVSYVWENGRVKNQTCKVGGFTLVNTCVYDKNGRMTSQIVNMGNIKTEATNYDFKFDDHGNWISRKTKVKVMGHEKVTTTTRSFEYYQ